MAIGLPRDLCGVPANPGMDQVQEQEKSESRKYLKTAMNPRRPVHAV